MAQLPLDPSETLVLDELRRQGAKVAYRVRCCGRRYLGTVNPTRCSVCGQALEAEAIDLVPTAGGGGG